MVITVGDSSWPNILSDNPVVASAVFAIYMNPGSININWQNILVNKLAVQGDNSLATTAGGNELTVPLADCKYENTVSNWATIQMALQYWSKKNLLIYLTIKDKNSTNMAVMPSVDFDSWSPRVYNAADFAQIKTVITAERAQIKEEYLHITFNTLRSTL